MCVCLYELCVYTSCMCTVLLFYQWADHLVVLIVLQTKTKAIFMAIADVRQDEHGCQVLVMCFIRLSCSLIVSNPNITFCLSYITLKGKLFSCQPNSHELINWASGFSVLSSFQFK